MIRVNQTILSDPEVGDCLFGNLGSKGIRVTMAGCSKAPLQPMLRLKVKLIVMY